MYINTVREYNDVGILIIEICIPTRVAKHLNRMRVEMSNDFDLSPTNNLAYTKYSKSFQRPTDDEFGSISETRRKIVGYPFLLVNVREFWFIYMVDRILL